MSKRKFFKTVIRVEILSEDEPVGSDMNLNAIHHAITDGDFSGDCKVVEQKQVSAKEMAKLLIKQGSDPGFLFSIDEKGNDVDE